MSLTIVHVEIDGYMCEVHCVYEPSTPGNWDEPDSGEFWVEKVYLNNEERPDLELFIDDKLEDKIFDLCERGKSL